VRAVTILQKNCIYLYDGEDQLIRTICKGGNHFSCISLATFDDEDYLYVGDCHRIQKFTINGDYLLQFVSDNDQTKYYFGLIVHKGKVYTTNAVHYISVFLTDGTFYQTIRREQVGLVYDSTYDQRIRGLAHDVTVTNNDELLVVDYKHNNIYKFTLDGDYVGKFTQFNELYHPNCIATDPHGFIFVTASLNQRLVVDKDGNFIHRLSLGGDDNGVLHQGIAINKNGDIYVTDLNVLMIFSGY